MIPIIKIVVQSLAYATIARIMANNNIPMKTKSYWCILGLALFLYIFGFIMGKIYMVG